MITKPTILLDEEKCRQNIEWMFAKAKSKNVLFRPHFKTHQSVEIGNWFKEIGVDKITVSSVSMAEYFAGDWSDITIAFPVNIPEIDAINALAKRITLNLLVENIQSVDFLSKNLHFKVNVFLKIDVGNHRTGILPTNIGLIRKILKSLDESPLLNFIGFLGHAGHTYDAKSTDAVKVIHDDSLKAMHSLRKTFEMQYPDLIISLGDTPGCSIAEDFSGVDEIRPGNFVFYDLTQLSIGSNTISQIAIAVACPVVAIHKERSEIVVYGGGVHLSKERMEENGRTIYGKVVEKTSKGWGDIIPETYVKSLSQEHGIIVVPQGELPKYRIGDYVLVLPVHSCMTANLHSGYTTLDGWGISRM